MSLWLASYIVLWLLVLLVVLSVVVLFRQLGVLHLRFGPRGALSTEEGPELQAPAPVVDSVDTSGRTWRVGGTGQPTTLVFVSPQCSICEDLLPAIRAVHRSIPPDSQLMVVSTGNDEVSASHARRLKPVPVLADPSVAEVFRVVATPFAVHVDGSGLVVRKGVVNTREQLESVADEPGHAFVGVEDLQRSSNGQKEVHSHEHA